jgi:hypothetical protein
VPTEVIVDATSEDPPASCVVTEEPKLEILPTKEMVEATTEVVEPPAQIEHPIYGFLLIDEITSMDYDTWYPDTWVPIPTTEL